MADLTTEALVEAMARAIAARRGWKWDLMPSFGDHFTKGCSHEECRADARAALAALGNEGKLTPIACHLTATDLEHLPAPRHTRVAALLRVIADA